MIFSFIFVFAFSGWAYYFNEMKNIKSKYQHLYGVADFLKANDLKFGFATFWNANKNTILSNHDIQIGGIDVTDHPVPYYHLTSLNFFDPAYHQGKSFLMLSEEEKKSLNNEKMTSIFGNPMEIKNALGFTFYIYSYNIASKMLGSFLYNQRTKEILPYMLSKVGGGSISMVSI